MSALPALLTDATVLAAATGLSYSVTLLGVALVSVLSRTPTRRRDARATLAILVRRLPRGTGATSGPGALGRDRLASPAAPEATTQRSGF